MASEPNCLSRRSFVKKAAAGVAAGSMPATVIAAEQSRSAPASKSRLTPRHIAAIRRRRRVVVNYDTGFGAPEIAKRIAGMDTGQLVKSFFSMIDEPTVQMTFGSLAPFTTCSR